MRVGVCSKNARVSGLLDARLRGRTATQRSKKNSEKVLGRVLGRGSQKGSLKGACYGFSSKEKSSRTLHV